MSELIETLPVLPIKNSVLFPGLLMPLTAGRPSSIAAIDAALASEDKELLIITQRDSAVESPTASDLYTIGTKAVVKRMMRRQDGAVNLIVFGYTNCCITGTPASSMVNEVAWVAIRPTAVAL